MTIYSINGYSPGSVINLPASANKGGQGLENYLLNSTEKLNALTEFVNRGDEVDRDSRDWMLAQVDFVVDTIGNEGLDLSDETRSNLLQLLLALANLNEQIRRQA
jgi:hypothetical protein